MPSQTVIVAGPVLNVDVREGVGRQSGEPYRIVTARVLVESTGIAEVTLPRAMVAPGQGEDVAYLADVDVYNGQPSLRAVRAVPALLAAASA